MIERERIQTQLATIAGGIDSELARVEDALHFLAAYSQERFSVVPNDRKRIRAWLDRNEHEANGITGMGAGKALRYDWPNNTRDNPAATYRLFCHTSMGPLLYRLQTRLPGAFSIRYHDASGATLHSPGETHPHAEKSLPSPLADQPSPGADVPRSRVYWSPPYTDLVRLATVISGYIPIIKDNQLLGIWNVELLLDTLIKPSLLTPTHESQTTCIVRSDGTVVTSSRDVFNARSNTGPETPMNFREAHEAFSQLDIQQLSPQQHTCMVTVDSLEYLFFWERLSCADWLCMTALRRDALLDAAKEQFRRAFSHLGNGEFAWPLDIERLPGELLDIGVAYNEAVNKLHSILTKDTAKTSSHHS